MSKQLKLIVTVDFSDPITDDNEIMEVAKNILRAIKHGYTSGEGISPEDSEGITEKVTVTPQFLDESVTETF